jgi:hypothetical protein
VLIEDPDPAWHRMMGTALLVHGYEVAFCAGPAARPGGCSLVTERACPLVESADVIINSLTLDRPENRAVLTALRISHPRTPLIALVSHRDGREHASCLHGCTIEHFPTTVHDLLALLEALVAS